MDLSEILSHPVPLKRTLSGVPQDSEDSADDILTPAQRKKFFKTAHGRKVSSIAQHYPLPVDDDEIKVCVSRTQCQSPAHLIVCLHSA